MSQLTAVKLVWSIRLTWSWGFWMRSELQRFRSFWHESLKCPVLLVDNLSLPIDLNRPKSWKRLFGRRERNIPLISKHQKHIWAFKDFHVLTYVQQKHKFTLPDKKWIFVVVSFSRQMRRKKNEREKLSKSEISIKKNVSIFLPMTAKRSSLIINLREVWITES